MKTCWGIQWQSNNSLNGETKHFLWNGLYPLVFYTRKEARKYIQQRYTFIKERPDLQQEPHGWKMPQAKQVKVELIEI